MLQNANLEKRGALLREICIIDEYLKDINDDDAISSSPNSIEMKFIEYFI